MCVCVCKGKLVWMDMLNAINVDSKISWELMRYFQGPIKSDHNNMYNRDGCPLHVVETG